MSINIYGDILYKFKILTNEFDYAAIRWCIIEPFESGLIIIRFDLNAGVDPPTTEILHDIATIIKEVNENVKGIYFYALKDDRLVNLYAFNNQIRFIKDFQSNHFEAYIFVTRIHYRQVLYYLMTKGRDCLHYRNLKIYIDSEQTDSIENQFKELIDINATTRLSLKEIGKFHYEKFPFLFGKWNLSGNIYLADLKCGNLADLCRLLKSTDGSSRILFTGNNFKIGIIGFKDTQTAEFNFDRQNSQEESILLPECMNIHRREHFEHYVETIRFLDSNKRGKFEKHVDYPNGQKDHVFIDI